MSGLEWLQLGLVGAVALAVLWGLVSLFRRMGAVFPEVAKKYGLALARESQGSVFTNVRQLTRLDGVVDGIPIQVVSTYETRGRMRMRGTRMATTAPKGSASCRFNVLHSAPATSAHRVPVDAAFDRRRWVTSDAPDRVRRLLTPAVLDSLLRCPQREIQVVVEDGYLVLSFPGTPTSRDELEGPIAATLALARGANA